jgi:hypothetical protein
MRPWTLKPLHLQRLPCHVLFPISQLLRLWTQNLPNSGEEQHCMRDKTLEDSSLGVLLFVCGASFCTSKFYLACWFLSCVLSLIWHPNILKIFLTTWVPAWDFHTTQGAMETPSSGQTHPAALLHWPRGLGDPLSLWPTMNSKSKVNRQCRKGGRPNQALWRTRLTLHGPR